MFKAVRITILLLILAFVSVSTWLTQSRSTDWNNSLWVKIYPINGDGSDPSARYIASLEAADFAGIETFIAREVQRYGRALDLAARDLYGIEAVTGRIDDLYERLRSGGRRVMSLAVATTKTGWCRSESQVRNCPNMRCPTPLSRLCPSPAKAFSSSSIHSTQGAASSAVSRMWASG